MRTLLTFKPLKEKPLSMEAMTEQAREYMDRHDFKPLSIRIALQNIRWLVQTYDLAPDRLTAEREEQIKADMKRRELASNTIRQRLYAYEYLAASMGHDVRVKKPPRNKTKAIYATIAEAREMLDHAENARDRGILACGLYCGLRPGETCKLRPCDVDLDRRELHVLDPKNGEDRDVVLTQEAAEIMGEWLNCRPASRTPYLFMTQHDNQLDTQSINRMIKRTLKAAGIEKPLSGHRLRHTAATSMLRMGIPLPEVALQLGDTIETVYTYYLHGDVEELKRCVDAKFKY